MLTRSEKSYLFLTLAFLAAGLGLKVWRRATVRLGPFPDAATSAQDSARVSDSTAGANTAAFVSMDPDSAHASASVAAAGDSAAVLPDIAGEAGSHPARGRLADGLRNEGGPRKASRSGSGLSGKIDLNRADAAGLLRIDGIGEKTAAAILAYRRAHGPFRDVRDLLQIKGIGEKKLEKLAPHIIL